MGFEPMKPFWSLHTFQACAFDHSANSPVEDRKTGKYSLNILPIGLRASSQSKHCDMNEQL